MHLKLFLLVTLPSIIIWVICTPIFAALLIKRHKVIIKKGEEELDKMTPAEIQRFNQIFTRYGFLYNGYRLTKYYWEVIIMYRKIGIILVSVFLASVSAEV